MKTLHIVTMFTFIFGVSSLVWCLDLKKISSSTRSTIETNCPEQPPYND